MPAKSPPRDSATTDQNISKALGKRSPAKAPDGPGLSDAATAKPAPAPIRKAPGSPAAHLPVDPSLVARPAAGPAKTVPPAVTVRTSVVQTPRAADGAAKPAAPALAPLKPSAPTPPPQGMVLDKKAVKAEEKRKAKEEKLRARHMAIAAAEVKRRGTAPDRPVTEVPEVPPNLREVERNVIVPDRSWIRILFDEGTHTYLYDVLEPTMTNDEKEILAFLRDTLVRTLEGSAAARHGGDREAALLEAARQAVVDHSILLDDVGTKRVEYHLLRDFLGYGAVDALMRDPMIEDISCDGPGIPVFLFHRKYESLRTNVVFTDEFELDAFVIRLAQRSGKHISVADPLLDATLPDGSRLQATLGREVTTRGSSFTVRKFRADPLTPPDLVRYGTISVEMAAYFWFVMEMGASFLLAGGTASGKTTSLNAICQFIPPEKKIVSIEDTREINLSHENWIAGITRSGFGGEIVGGKLAGSIDMYKLLEAALRQRPEYLLVGEVRGPEALTLFQAMATGHAVYSTMHADSVPSAVYRLESEPINVPRMMLQTLDIVAIQAQVRIRDRLTRRIREVTEVVGFDPDTKELLTNTVFEWDVTQDKHKYLGKSYILEQVMESRNLSEAKLQEEWTHRIEVMQWMMDNSIRHYADVARAIASYYREPSRFLDSIRTNRRPVLAAGGAA